MGYFYEWISSAWAERFAWVILHFLWQGTLIGVVTLSSAALFRLPRGLMRYSYYLFGLCLMAVAPVVTWQSLARDVSSGVSLPPLSHTEVAEERVASGEVEVLHFEAIVAQETSVGIQLFQSDEVINNWIRLLSPWSVVFWAGGVALLSFRLLLGQVGLLLWGRSLQPLPDEWHGRLQSVVEKFGEHSLSRVFLSPKVSQPLALGLLFPKILLPVSFLTQMPVEVLEAAIAHELAHLRRKDAWVNWLQRVVETLLFFHPMVWWLSHRIREEREICCDEVAAQVIGSKHRYAEVLAHCYAHHLGESGSQQLALGLGGANRGVMSRVQHLLGVTSSPCRTRGLAVLFCLLTLAATFVYGFKADESKAPEGEGFQLSESFDMAEPFEEIEVEEDVEVAIQRAELTLQEVEVPKRIPLIPDSYREKDPFASALDEVAPDSYREKDPFAFALDEVASESPEQELETRWVDIPSYAMYDLVGGAKGDRKAIERAFENLLSENKINFDSEKGQHVLSDGKDIAFTHFPSVLDQVQKLVAPLVRKREQYEIQAYFFEIPLKELNASNIDWLSKAVREDSAKGALDLTAVLEPEVIADTLAALKRLPDSSLLSSPKVFTLEGREARIMVAEEMRYPTSYGSVLFSSGDEKTSITSAVPQEFETEEVGVTVSLRAESVKSGIHFHAKSRVVELEGFIQKGRRALLVGDEQVTEFGAGNYPVFYTREVETDIVLQNGMALLICGLEKEAYYRIGDERISKRPAELPISKKSVRKELLVLMTVKNTSGNH